MADQLDMENRDSNGINDHIKIAFEDTLAEVPGAQAIDCVWGNSYSLSHSVVSKTNNTGKHTKEKTSQKQLDINRFTTPNRKQETLKARTPPTPPDQDRENKASKI